MLENGKDIHKINMRFTVVLWLTLCGSAMALMLWFSANKTIVIADGAAEKTENVQMPARERDLRLEETGDSKKSFCIPLPQNVKAGNIVMENHYMDGELWLYIKSVSESFYDECVVLGNVSAITQGKCGEQGDGILLKLQMAEMFEYKSTMEGNTLVIAYDSPGAMYGRTIVIDPAGGGEENGLVSETTNMLYEKEVALQVAKQVQKKLSLPGVKVYLTRTDDSYVSSEQRLELIKAADADMYIRIGVASDEESAEQYGISCYYNEAFYLPDFGNVEWSDIVAKEVTIASGNKAIGLIPAEDDSILREIEIPATHLSVGYFSNEKERELLGRDAYREKLAEGIVAAITKACESLEKIEQDKTEQSETKGNQTK